jgi:hypothetical protein
VLAGKSLYVPKSYRIAFNLDSKPYILYALSITSPLTSFSFFENPSNKNDIGSFFFSLFVAIITFFSFGRKRY